MTEAPRILHVFGGAVRSGVESVVLALAKGSRRAGGEPVLVPIAEGVFTDEARALGFDVRPLGKLRRYDLSTIQRLAALMREAKPDIVHSHGVNGAFYASPAVWLAGIRRHVNTFHADTREVLMDVYRSELPRVLADRYHVWLAKRCTRVTTVSERLRQRLLAAGMPAEDVEYIPNGVDVAAYRAALPRREAIRAELGIGEQTCLLGTIGRLAAVKNLPMLLRVAAALKTSEHDVRFVVAGVGPDEEQIHALARELGVADVVRFTGWRDDADDLLAALDIYLLTSHSEACPVALQGAMALARPVVSTAVGFLEQPGPLHALGLVVPLDDAEGMARAVLSLLDDAALAARAGDAAKAMVDESFTRDRIERRFHDFYAEVMRR